MIALPVQPRPLGMLFQIVVVVVQTVIIKRAMKLVVGCAKHLISIIYCFDNLNSAFYAIFIIVGLTYQIVCS